MISKTENLKQLQSFFQERWAKPSYIFDHIHVIAKMVEVQDDDSIEGQILSGAIDTLCELSHDECLAIINTLEKSTENENIDIRLTIKKLHKIIKTTNSIRHIASTILGGFDNTEQCFTHAIKALVVSIQKEREALDSMSFNSTPLNLKAA